MQCIIIAHTTKIISNQIRQNITNILITVGNTAEFYKQLEEVYNINHPIENYKEQYGMILYEIRKNKITFSNALDNTGDSNMMLKYYQKEKLTSNEENEIKNYLEKVVDYTIFIPNELIIYYSPLYLHAQGEEVDVSRLRHIYNDYYISFKNYKNEISTIRT